MKPRILVADDEANAVQALRRLLHSRRQEWLLDVAANAAEALALLEAAPADLIITDMQMPGMDGAELLEEVARRYPGTIRMILSGDCHGADLLRALASAHQIVAKPCEAPELIDAIQRVFRLRSLIPSPELRRLVTGLRALPVLADAYVDIQRELTSGVTSLEALGELISQDVGLSAKILHLANAAQGSLRRAVTAPAEALDCLGMDAIRVLLLEEAVVSHVTVDPRARRSAKDLTSHSRITAAVARAIAEAEGLGAKAVGHAFLAGLLHDVGSLLLATCRPDGRGDGGEDADTLCAAERRAFSASHAEVGAYLTGLWGLPTPVVEAIANHHTPAASPAADRGIVLAVHVATALVHNAGMREPLRGGGQYGEGIDCDCLATEGLLHRLPLWQQLAAPFFQAAD